jgi:hypothetical protein
MSLPAKPDLETLDYAYLGVPFCTVVSKDQDTGTLDYAYLGVPFYAAGGAAPPPPAYNATQFFMVF